MVDVVLGLWLIGLAWQGRVTTPENHSSDTNDGD